MDKPNNSGNLLVWDLPLRLFHWGLSIAVIIAVVSVENDRMDCLLYTSDAADE